MNAAIYVRVSTEAHPVEGGSLAAQEAMCDYQMTTYCLNRNPEK